MSFYIFNLIFFDYEKTNIKEENLTCVNAF